jgi:thymidylate kinase
LREIDASETARDAAGKQRRRRCRFRNLAARRLATSSGICCSIPKQNRAMSSETELLLFEASRSHLVREKIQPALQHRGWMICDRFFDSTTVYEGAARHLDVHREKIRGGMEEESDQFYERVICACRDLARNEAQRVVLIDARPSADMVETEIWNLLVRRFPEFENNQISTVTLQSS